MSGCTCENPTDFRATSENAGEEFLYLRCGHCGGKAGRVEISMDDLTSKVTDPNDLDAERKDVAEKVIEHETPTVSIHFNARDSPWMFETDNE